MKKTGVLLFSMLLLTGTLLSISWNLPERESSFYRQEETGAGQTVQKLPEQVLARTDDALRKDQENCYAFAQLAEEEQDLYLEILDALLYFRENVRLSSCDKDLISRTFQCVLNDHPEIFYVDGYTYTEYTLGTLLKKITFTGSYNISREEAAQKQTQIENYVNQCLVGLPKDADEYETVKYIYEYLIHHTDYDAAAKDSQNICSVFLERKSVCQGYAKATQYLLNRAGIESTLVLGRVVGGEGHAWNLVRIDGAYYYVDTTWGDASYQAAGSSYPAGKIPTINYDYLCVTTEQMEQTHTFDNVVELPVCTATDANYYVREGVYFTDWDEEKVERIFADSYRKGEAYVTLKCAGPSVYQKMRGTLIDEQEIFRYLDCQGGSVSYVENEKQYSLSFWL
ncbi:MAG: hypothetical protein NC302_05615 [Bacteroidales bacterium]|nr:hypothetical protein [Bacteroidales bacterium]MCM1415488.1 hypothetical protein [bacterium]MCM1423425.1 hypothetical protein [bacterium]